jgi:signal transduction histidine kinase
MSKNDLTDYFSNTTEVLSLMESNLSKAAKLIKSFKLVSLDQNIEDKLKFKLNDYIAHILISLHLITRKTNLDIKVICPDDLELNSYPGSFSQIFTNLIMNSIVHGFKEKEAGNLIIKISVDNKTVYMSYEDDGQGISEETYAKIFDPFFTTNRKHGGSGLGMHIIYNIITSKLNGTIECEYKSRKGIKFNIEFEK